MRHKDLKPAHDLCQWDTPIVLPILHRFHILDVDDEIFLLAFVMNFRLGGVAAGHIEFDLGGDWVWFGTEVDGD